MMKKIFLLFLICIALKASGQTTGYFRYDTVRIFKQGGTAELYLINKTKDSLGVLTNVGGGLTRFIKSRALNDSTIIVGLDTFVLRGANGVPDIANTHIPYGDAANKLTSEAALTYTESINRVNAGTGNFADSLIVGRLRTGTTSDSVVVWDNITKALKKVLGSTFITASNGLTKTGNNITLGGLLTGSTFIEGEQNYFGITNTSQFQAVSQNPSIPENYAEISLEHSSDLRLRNNLNTNQRSDILLGKQGILFAVDYDLLTYINTFKLDTTFSWFNSKVGIIGDGVSSLTDSDIKSTLHVFGDLSIRDTQAGSSSDSVLVKASDGKVKVLAQSSVISGGIAGNLPKNNLNNGLNAEKNTFLSGEGNNGVWKDIGASTFFKAGDATFPASGDSLYTNLSLADYLDYDVYRDGSLQYWDSVAGVEVIPATGQFIFHPPLTSNEKINIKASRRNTLRTPPFPSFDVNTIANVFGWYDAGDATTITQVTGVSQWSDKTPNANNLVQATGGSQPTYFGSGGSNNTAFIRFASGKTLLRTYTTADSGALTVYMVVKMPANVASARIYSFRSAGGSNGVISNTGGTTGTYWGFTEYDGSLQNGADLNTGWGDWQVCKFTFKGSAAENVIKNRLAGYTKTLHNLGAGSPSNLGRFFAQFGTAAFDLGEAIIIKGEPSTTENTQIVNYLMSKYDVPVRPSILFFGDSHTSGAMSGTPTGEQYVILAAKEQGYDIMNQGHSGTVVYPINPYNGNTGNNLADLYSLYDTYLPANSPYVVFQYGTNDGNSPVNATWVTNYKAYIQHFIDAGVPASKIIICSPPYNSSATYATNLANARPVIAQIATDLGIQFCDFYTYTQSLGLDCNSTYTGGDGIHGNGTIHRALADLLKTFLP